jgi:hypothetical protein
VTRHRRRAALLAALAVSLAPVTAGCAAGFDAVTGQPFAPGDGLIGEIGDLQVNNLVVVGDDQGQGIVLLSVANRGTEPDTLQSVELPGGAEATLPQDTQIPFRGSLSLQGEDEVIRVTGLEQAPGQAVEVRLLFRQAGELALTTVVVPSGGYYRTYFEGNGEGATGIEDEPASEPSVLPTPAATPAPGALPTAGTDAQPPVEATAPTSAAP